MKTLLASAFVLASCLAVTTATAQVPTASVSPLPIAPAVQDGIVFHNGQPYVIRNGRALLIDATLIPQGQIYTNEGKLVPLPNNFTAFPAPSSTLPQNKLIPQLSTGTQLILPPEGSATLPARKGTDQPLLINPPRGTPNSKVTGSGGLPRK